MPDRPLKPRTIAAQALGAIEPETKAVALPVHVSTTFIRDPDNQYRTGYSYGRPDNATVRQTEAVIAALEGAHEALLFGSGMAAATSVVLALPPGSHVVAPQVCYWGFRDWLAATKRRCSATASIFADMTDLAAVRAAMKPDTKLVWIETPGNPLWNITDIAAVARDRARRAARVLGIDSTAATPVFTQPLCARRRHRDAFGDEISQRTFRRDRRRARGRAGFSALWTRIKQVRGHHGAILGRSRRGC